MFDFVKKTALAAAVAFAMAPAAVSAAVVDMTPTFTNIGVGGGGPYNLDAIGVDNFRWDNNAFNGADASGALFGFEFTADTLPQPTNAAVTLNLLGEFSGFQMAWSTDNVLDAGDLFFPAPTDVLGLGVSRVTTTFASVPQYLIVKYDSVVTGGNIDIRVAAVPLPAGGLLLMGALGGLAALRRRRKAA